MTEQPQESYIHRVPLVWRKGLTLAQRSTQVTIASSTGMNAASHRAGGREMTDRAFSATGAASGCREVTVMSAVTVRHPWPLRMKAALPATSVSTCAQIQISISNSKLAAMLKVGVLETQAICGLLEGGWLHFEGAYWRQYMYNPSSTMTS